MAGEGSLQVVVDRVGSPSSAADALASASASSKPSLQVIVLVSRLFSPVSCLSGLVVSPSHYIYKSKHISISAFFSFFSS